MSSMVKRDPFFRAQYWVDLCNGLGERAKNAEIYCSSDKVKPGSYEVAMQSRLFGSSYDLLLASYSKGADKAELAKVNDDLLKAIQVCSNLFFKNGKSDVLISHSYANLLFRELAIFSFSYVFLNEASEWDKLLTVSRHSHPLVNRLYSLKVKEPVGLDNSEFKHSSAFRLLYDVFDAPQEKRKALLAKYLKNWEKKVANKTFCDSQSRSIIIDDPEDEQYTAQYLGGPFTGTWAFEVAPLILHFEIDDSDFEQYYYYPKELVAMGREG